MKTERKKFYLMGSGRRWAWVRMDKLKKRIKWIDRPTGSDEAEYLGLINILRYVNPGSQLLIIVSSIAVYELFYGKRLYKQQHLKELRNQARTLVSDRELEVEIQYVHRSEHLIRRWFVLEKPPK
jgi:hypothetical protein